MGGFGGRHWIEGWGGGMKGAGGREGRLLWVLQRENLFGSSDSPDCLATVLG